MDKEEVKNICAERLGKWQERLVSEHATPVLLLGVGHDHKKGKTVVITTEDMSDEDLLLFIGGAHYEILRRVTERVVKREPS